MIVQTPTKEEDNNQVVKVDIDLVTRLRLEGNSDAAEALVRAHQMSLKKNFSNIRREINITKAKQFRIHMERKGLCPSCGKKNDTEFSRCPACKNKHDAARRRLTKERKRKKHCLRCDKLIRASKHTLCVACRRKQADYNAKRNREVVK